MRWGHGKAGDVKRENERAVAYQVDQSDPIHLMQNF